MKISYFVSLFLFAVMELWGKNFFSVIGSMEYTAVSNPLPPAKIIYRKLFGTLAGQPVVMDLTRSDSQIQGTYYYDKIGTPLFLSGTIAADYSFNLTEMYNGVETGKWIGRWSAASVYGRFTSTRSGKSFDFNLTDYQGNAAHITFESREKEDCTIAERRKNDPAYAQGESACSSVKVKLLKVSLPSSQAANAINRTIFKTTCTDDASVTTLDGYFAKLFSSNDEFNNQDATDDFITQSETSCDVHTNDDGILCVTVVSYSYMEGAAHGMTGISDLNFDLTTGRLIELDDLFRTGYRPALTPIVKRLFEAENGKLDPQYNSEGFKLSSEFAIQRNGILFQYGYYEVGPYVMGAPTALAPWKEIRHLLRPGAIPVKWLAQQ